jgi:sugar (pentulose or hexulose) kinase
VFAATDRPALDPQGRLHTFCHAIPGRWHVMGVTQAAGLSLRWFRDRFGFAAQNARDPYDILADEASAAPAGSEGALWLPYLMGERTPHLDPNARAALLGLTASHTRGHLIRAVMEGVAYSLKVAAARGRRCGDRSRRMYTHMKSKSLRQRKVLPTERRFWQAWEPAHGTQSMRLATASCA